jgi:hypothetical protein
MQGHPGTLWLTPQLASSSGGSSRSRERSLVAAAWLLVASAGTLVTVFGREFLPAKFSLDAAVLQSLLDSPGLWSGLSFDSYLNTARFWSLVFHVIPQAAVPPVFYCLMAAAVMALLRILDVQPMRYHLLAGGWVLCSSLSLSFPNKEMIALPVALWLCVAHSRAARFAAAIVFLLYAALFRQYWAICFFYFASVLVAFRLHIAGRGALALLVAVAAYALPFVVAGAADYAPLTDARMMVNADRVDDPNARSAFNNALENTGVLTDMANAALAWPYMNVPVALASKASPHCLFFGVFQVCTLWFFVAGCASFLRDAKRMGYPGSTYLRCCAFVIAYSVTQAIFEPDFGSFLRHEAISMIPMLIVVFYRAHAKGTRNSQPRGLAYGRNLSA